MIPHSTMVPTHTATQSHTYNPCRVLILMYMHTTIHIYVSMFLCVYVFADSMIRSRKRYRATKIQA